MLIEKHPKLFEGKSVDAYLRGIYKYSYFPKAGEPNIGYGKFHVVLRKENGVWKILTDYDSSEGGKVGEADYKAAHAVDDFAKF